MVEDGGRLGSTGVTTEKRLFEHIRPAFHGIGKVWKVEAYQLTGLPDTHYTMVGQVTGWMELKVELKKRLDFEAPWVPPKLRPQQCNFMRDYRKAGGNADLLVWLFYREELLLIPGEHARDLRSGNFLLGYCHSQWLLRRGISGLVSKLLTNHKQRGLPDGHREVRQVRPDV